MEKEIKEEIIRRINEAHLGYDNKAVVARTGREHLIWTLFNNEELVFVFHDYKNTIKTSEQIVDEIFKILNQNIKRSQELTVLENSLWKRIKFLFKK